MVEMAAFQKRPELKSELTDGLKPKAALLRLLLGGASGELRFEFFSKEYGIDPVLCRLIVALGASDRDADGCAFVLDAVSAIAVGQGTADCAAQWLLWGWGDAQSGLSRVLQGTALAAGSERVMALVRSSRQCPVSAGDWRTARRGLATTGDVDPVAARFAEVVAAMAWDMDQAPGAIQDVVNAWMMALTAESFRDNGWSDEQEKAGTAVYWNFYQQALASLTAAQNADNELRRSALEDAVAKLFAESGQSALLERQKACRMQAWGHVNAWMKRARSALIDIVKAEPSSLLSE